MGTNAIVEESDPLSLSERVGARPVLDTGVRVKSTNTYPCHERGLG